MTDRSIPPVPGSLLTQEQIDAISGAGCTVDDVLGALGKLKDSYEQLVDFTSYVIERVAGGPQP